MIALPNLPAARTWIGGTAEPSAVPDHGPLHDPNTGALLGSAGASSPQQLERAIAAATAAHADGSWWRLGVEGRAPYLLALADELDGVAERIAVLDALNSGVPISVTRLFGGSNGETVRAAVGHARDEGDSRAAPADGRDVRVHHVPWGPAALITPWNAPSAMAVKKLAYALAAGAPVVLKPSSASPWSAQLVLDAVTRAGIPEGVVSLVEGGREIGSRLVADPRIRAVSMTGSTPTGRRIAAAAAPNFTRLRLELGSNNAAIVRADADVELTADRLATGFLKLSGQWCEAPRRVFVARSLAAELIDALVARLHEVRIGSSLEDATELGPVAFEARRRELETERDALAAAGGRVIAVGDIPGDGWFVAPTLVVDSGIEPEGELFGPVLAVSTVADDAEALRRSNAGTVGLAGYVFSRDEETARALGLLLDGGEIKVNGTSVLDMSRDSEQAFFGASGIGGHGDRGVLRFFTGPRIVGTDAVGLPI